MNILSNKVIKKAVNLYGTPLYLYDSNTIVNTYRKLRLLSSNEIDIYYSLKANPLLAICQILNKEKANCEVCSLAELHIALSAGFKPKNIIFVGPGKSEKELNYAITYRIKAIVCESIEEAIKINEISKRKKIKCKILLRINPNFTAINAPLKMGGKPVQFGIDLDDLEKRINIVIACKNIKIIGIHVYNGTRILDAETVVCNTENILNLSDIFSKKWSIKFECVGIGGGFGVPYFEGETSLDIENVFKLLNPKIKAYQVKNPNTKIILESGRYLLAESGVFISKIVSVKDSHNEKFLITDGGMNCHMAASGIGSIVKRNFPIDLINSKTNHKNKINKYNITGPLCTPGDLLGRQINLPEAKIGDLITIHRSGAYGSSASPGRFLSHGYSAEAIYRNNKFYLIKRRENIKDITSTQIKLNNL